MAGWECSLSLKLYDDPWKIKKVLSDSDASNRNQLLLSTDLVDNLVLPVLGAHAQIDATTQEGTQLQFWDVDTESEHQLVLKRRRNYFITEEWNQDFINRRRLNAGDEIGLQWDPYNNRFNFTVLKRA